MYSYGSCAKIFSSLHVQVSPFWKKTVITLVFKLKGLVIGNKSDLGGDV